MQYLDETELRANNIILDINKIAFAYRQRHIIFLINENTGKYCHVSEKFEQITINFFKAK